MSYATNASIFNIYTIIIRKYLDVALITYIVYIHKESELRLIIILWTKLCVNYFVKGHSIANIIKGRI